MKQTLLWLAVATTLASCGSDQGKNSDTTDSTATHVNIAMPSGDGSQPDYGNTLIAIHEANTWIQNYHHFVHFDDDTTQVLSFMLDARKLKDYLNSDTALEKLDIYLARTSAGRDGEMRLVYIGAKNVGTADHPVYKETAITVGTNEYMLDHGIPCPHCERDPLHQPPTQ
jgi:hypothetical protein